MPDTVLLDQRSDGVLLVTLNRPESLNAINTELSTALRETLAAAAQDPDVRCVALTGAGRAFCAGGDVKSMRERSYQEGLGSDGEYHTEIAIAAMEARQTGVSGILHTMPKPTVALVNGFAMGAGFAIALACDLRLCSEKAKFGMAFRNVGLPGDFGGSYFLPRIVGQGVAREIFFSGEPITMDRAEALGLANRVYTADDFLPQALEYVSRLGQGPTKALGRMKANLNRSGEDSTMEEILTSEAVMTRMSRDDADHTGAVQAFIQGDKPVFSGR
ncbi:MAG: 2-(1,2-epoxy-1,2-dihydrophenyl) acetyl-CoA isomerase [Chloroflexi bacterium]|jgi:2-(1,2-epoxy-1,2-dihydrophenyl)acetyl-CoA isomerase|nr:MAG: 2-(1,2-epoxy-1,2-dihydrophenyl) acetyl-CoA isomerase [Chloroflexota bacterium]